MYISLNCSEDVPKSNPALVLGLIAVDVATSCWAGPITVIAPPSAAVPSCVWPVEELNAASIASYSPSKSAALITLPSAILFAVLFRV